MRGIRRCLSLTSQCLAAALGPGVRLITLFTRKQNLYEFLGGYRQDLTACLGIEVFEESIGVGLP